MQPLPFFCRWLFAPLVIATSAVTGFLFFCVMDWLDPVHELEYWFYAVPYTCIGAVTGIAAWYFARLSARGSLSLVSAALILLVPYAFIMSLALDKNPFVAIIATAAFGFILLLAWLARFSRHHAIDSAQQSNQAPTDG